MIETHTIETKTHGRYLVRRGAGRRLLVGFHGYAENAELHLAELEKLDVDWTLVAVQALHPFYTRTQEVVANWMTRQNREHAIADNIDYVRRVASELGPHETLVFAGFSQGTAMAYRAAAAIGCHGVIALAGDLPPDVTGLTVPVLIGRGESDEWYTPEKLNKDMSFLPGATTCVFPGGHEWTEPFREAARRFLGRMS